MAKFTEKELHIYEAEIRKKPLDQLYQEQRKATEDESTERQNIVKARIEVLKNRERRFFNAKQKILDKPQPLPDKDGFKHFLLVITASFAIILFELLFSSDILSFLTNFNLGRFLGVAKYFPTVGIFVWFTYYIPFFRKFFWDEKKSTFKDIPEFWLRHFKIALSFASFLFIFSLEIFSTGTYNGVFHSRIGLPAYLIATGDLFASTLYIINTFYPINKKVRPFYGIELLAFAISLELIIFNIFS